MASLSMILLTVTMLTMMVLPSPVTPDRAPQQQQQRRPTSSNLGDLLVDLLHAMDAEREPSRPADAEEKEEEVEVPLASVGSGPVHTLSDSPLFLLPPGLLQPEQLNPPSGASDQNVKLSSYLSGVFPQVSNPNEEISKQRSRSFSEGKWGEDRTVAKPNVKSIYALPVQSLDKRGRTTTFGRGRRTSSTTSTLRRLEFPVGYRGYLQGNSSPNKPQARLAMQRKSSPSLYLFGGAIGR